MKDAPFILDASALIAFIVGEPGAEMVAQLMPQAIISSVNITEVATRMIRGGLKAEESERLLRDLALNVVPFSEQHAWIAASLTERTISKGISLGDRACLALAIATKGTVVTGDRVWKTLGLDVKIVEFRS